MLSLVMNKTIGHGEGFRNPTYHCLGSVGDGVVLFVSTWLTNHLTGAYEATSDLSTAFVSNEVVHKMACLLELTTSTGWLAEVTEAPALKKWSRTFAGVASYGAPLDIQGASVRSIAHGRYQG